MSTHPDVATQPTAPSDIEVETVDVLQVGYGPGGQALSALLASLGHRVLVAERHPELYNLPRAGHIDHEVVRIVQATGGADEFEAKLWKVSGDYVYVNGDYEVLMSHPIEVEERSVSGWHSDYTLYQPDLEDALHRAVIGLGVEVALGWEVVEIDQDPDRVTALLRRVEYRGGQRSSLDEWRRVEAQYLVAADGASSFVRKALGIGQIDLGFNEQFLDVDMLTLREHTFDPNMAQICDPARPRMLIPMGPRHRRFEWALLPDETVEEMEAEDTAWRLLDEFGVTPETHQIVRQIVYAFQARVAERWRERRIFLAGDAAHTMPPFAGQGLCSAVRDGANLAWKLHLVLAGLADDAMLDSYEAERRPHALAWTAISMEEGKINCVWDPVEAAERDKRFKAGWRPPVFDLPSLEAGVLAQVRPHPLTGKLCIQADVRRGDTEGLLEDLIPRYRVNILAYGFDPRAVLDPDQLTGLSRLGANLVRIDSAGSPPVASADDTASTDTVRFDEVLGSVHVSDVDGDYGKWFAAHGAVAVIERPDFYVFGAAESDGDLSVLVDDLLAQLHPVNR
jgi:2-polyprenyl-6-methoxyphenol hydroxylase-like FAD-dependent oxidoreductase